jgi:hypothetical protein
MRNTLGDGEKEECDVEDQYRAKGSPIRDFKK